MQNSPCAKTLKCECFLIGRVTYEQGLLWVVWNFFTTTGSKVMEFILISYECSEKVLSFLDGGGIE